MSVIDIVANPVSWFRNQQVIAQSTSLLQKGDLRTRESAAAILGHLGGSKAERALINALKDSLPVRKAAVESLKHMRAGNKLATLSIKQLKQGDLLEREAAAWTLGEIEEQTEHAIDPLVESLHDRFKLVRETAAKSLEKLGKPAMQKMVAYLEKNTDRLSDEELLTMLRLLRRFEPDKEQLARLEPLLLSLLLTGNACRDILLETKELMRHAQCS